MQEIATNFSTYARNTKIEILDYNVDCNFGWEIIYSQLQAEPEREIYRVSWIIPYAYLVCQRMPAGIFSLGTPKIPCMSLRISIPGMVRSLLTVWCVIASECGGVGLGGTLMPPGDSPESMPCTSVKQVDIDCMLS